MVPRRKGKGSGTGAELCFGSVHGGGNHRSRGEGRGGEEQKMQPARVAGIGLPVTRERGRFGQMESNKRHHVLRSGPRVGHGHHATPAGSLPLRGGVAGGIQLLAGTRHRTAIEATTLATRGRSSLQLYKGMIKESSQKQRQNHVERYSTFVNPDHGFKTRDRSPSPPGPSGQQRAFFAHS